MQASDITLFIDPFSYHFERDALFNSEDASKLGDDSKAPFIHLHRVFTERGIRVHTADRLLEHGYASRLNLFMSFGLLDRYRAAARRADLIPSAFFGFESPVVDPRMYRKMVGASSVFKRMYSFSDQAALAPFFPSPLARELLPFQIPYPLDGVREQSWCNEDRQFMVVINHNKVPAVDWQELYSQRTRALEYFGRFGEIDLYGRGWDGPSFIMGSTWLPGSLQYLRRWSTAQWQKLRPDPLLVAARRVYRGVAASKIETLGRYRFSICFENVYLKGWITEKIFDCLVAGTIPIYWGAADIEQYVWPECFIDMRRMGGFDELRAFLHGLSATAIREYREAGRAYLQSAEFAGFGKQAFAELIGRIIQSDSTIDMGVQPNE